MNNFDNDDSNLLHSDDNIQPSILVSYYSQQYLRPLITTLQFFSLIKKPLELNSRQHLLLVVI